MRPDGLEADEEPWATQLVQLRSAVGRWTGNDGELIEYSRQESTNREHGYVLTDRQR